MPLPLIPSLAERFLFRRAWMSISGNLFMRRTRTCSGNSWRRRKWEMPWRSASCSIPITALSKTAKWNIISWKLCGPGIGAKATVWFWDCAAWMKRPVRKWNRKSCWRMPCFRPTAPARQRVFSSPICPMTSARRWCV